jgi:uncharacterized membrane protein
MMMMMMMIIIIIIIIILYGPHPMPVFYVRSRMLI